MGVAVQCRAAGTTPGWGVPSQSQEGPHCLEALKENADLPVSSLRWFLECSILWAGVHDY